MAGTKTPFPPPNVPPIGPDGQFSRVWLDFLLALFRRTGGSDGADVAALKTLIDQLTVEQKEQAVEIDEINAQAAALVAVPLIVNLSRRLDSMEERQLAPTHGIQDQPDLHALATATTAGFMSASDKTRVNALPTPASLNSIADAIASNTAADVVIISETLAAGSAKVGMQRCAQVYGRVSNGTTAGTLQFWIRINGVKVFTQAFTTTATAATGKGFFVAFDWAFRTIGATGTLQVAGRIDTNSTATPTSTPDALQTPATVDTTVALLVEIGFNWTAANASNIAVTKIASITGVV